MSSTSIITQNHLQAGTFTLGHRHFPQTSPLPSNVTRNTDELKASACRCKKERSVALKIHQNVFPGPCWMGSFPRPHNRLGRGHHFRTQPHSAPRFSRLDLGGVASQILISRIAPICKCVTLCNQWT